MDSHTEKELITTFSRYTAFLNTAPKNPYQRQHH